MAILEITPTAKTNRSLPDPKGVLESSSNIEQIKPLRSGSEHEKQQSRAHCQGVAEIELRAETISRSMGV
jgi:hypothetical protein